jgi:hypothetical protein
MSGGVGGRRIVEGAVVLVVVAGGGGGGGSRGAGMGLGMLRRHVHAAGVRPEGGSQSMHARPGCVV